eukprot:TRINITY_DN7041_c0_g2_i1.p1 TRINITY_DN7041_c0_g2~~TRINITY_DN7041_c0_g2_i1.p1  ORF type:complete len:638 (+),score=158.76 TRINITY_DN7041_c0_g2_i1:189-2102(+)
MTKKQERGKKGNVAQYTTRNQALNRLQIKLPEFRRLCILKGIHPREPKKKVHGQHKTYYHVKDINFLAREPLLATGREIKAHTKKVKKAKAKFDPARAERLQKNGPKYTLDHLVKERYPSFIDAVRDLDDPLTLVHLFASLPADSNFNIPADSIHTARRLCLEWQAYVTRTHALRKSFVSVKGIYYQADIWGQQVTWLVPHQLSQVLPNDVDFRVMLTFLEFYETMLEFVNFKLYHSLGLAYPPSLDPQLEEAAAGLSAVMAELASSSKTATAENVTGAKEETHISNGAASEEVPEVNGTNAEEQVPAEEAAARLAALEERLAAVGSATQDSEAPTNNTASSPEEHAKEGGVPADDMDDEETQRCRGLFQDCTFFLAREVPRESLLLVIRSFGGTVAWDGDGSPLLESDESITHQIVDRPTQGHRFLSRDYVQPQWVYDSSNSRVLLPTDKYQPSMTLPPHLSPFVDNDAEGYMPEYAATIRRLQAATASAKQGAEVSLLEGADATALSTSIALTTGPEVDVQEARYAEELAKELAGVPYSSSVGEGKSTVDEEDGSGDRENEEAPEAGKKPTVGEDDVEANLAKIMMTRKTKKLYDAMQMGREKKRASVDLLKERKRKAESVNKGSNASATKTKKH